MLVSTADINHFLGSEELDVARDRPVCRKEIKHTRTYSVLPSEHHIALYEGLLINCLQAIIHLIT